MAQSDASDDLAKWTFAITMIATALYALAVYFFVLGADVPDLTAPTPAVER